MQRHDVGVGIGQRVGHLPAPALQGDRARIARQTVERRAETAGEIVESVQSIALLESRAVQLQRIGRREATGAAAGRFLGVARMRRGVGAEKETVVSARGDIEQSLAVGLALEHGQAVVVGPHAAFEHGIAVVQQMMRREGCGQKRRTLGIPVVRLLNERGGLGRGDVLQHDLELGKSAAQSDEMPLDEHRLAVEHIHLGVGHFAVNQQRHPDLLHGVERRIDALEFGHSAVRISRCARRVELERMHHAAVLRLGHHRRGGVVGEIERHQRGEIAVLRQGGHDACAVVESLPQMHHGRLEIGHDDGPGELPCRPGQRITHGGAIT